MSGVSGVSTPLSAMYSINVSLSFNRPSTRSSACFKLTEEASTPLVRSSSARITVSQCWQIVGSRGCDRVDLAIGSGEAVLHALDHPLDLAGALPHLLRPRGGDAALGDDTADLVGQIMHRLVDLARGPGGSARRGLFTSLATTLKRDPWRRPGPPRSWRSRPGDWSAWRWSRWCPRTRRPCSSTVLTVFRRSAMRPTAEISSEISEPHY